ncbi:hypothetical protein FPE01S_03_02350 [Flavihumibacter petaseus NBRC 106054]|uniref:Uncharacterized protein n=1 Tax=Flavihumibacter petaseus NBRC 106054 TaxID=1220578 RepID=A0A0E9N2G7_9BACT|nr:hypothetical protein FPE01S_03_02350 [Flavihumibacter petaseus NBRC 106054]
MLVTISAGLLIWGFLLTDQTFMATRTKLLLLAAGAVPGVFLFYRIWKGRQGIYTVFFYGMLTGAAVSFPGVMIANYYWRDPAFEQVSLPVLETGNKSKRKRACRTPYAVVNYAGVNKRIFFPCSYEQSIHHFSVVQLEIQEGLLGFPVFFRSILIAPNK